MHFTYNTMKQLLLFLSICLSTTVAYTQTITPQDLQGTWKLVSFDVSGVLVDVVNARVTFTPELQGSVPAEELEKIKAGMIQSMDAFKAANTVFTGNRITQTMGPKVNTGKFAIENVGEKQFLFISENGNEDDVKIYMEGKLLHFVQADDEHPVNFAFIKQ